MKIFDKVLEYFAEMGEGCDGAYDHTINLYYMLKTGSIGTRVLMGMMILISSFIMTILFGLAMTSVGFIGPIVLWVAFSYYSHSSPFLSVRMGWTMWYIAIQLAIGVSCIAIASLLF